MNNQTLAAINYLRKSYNKSEYTDVDTLVSYLENRFQGIELAPFIRSVMALDENDEEGGDEK